MEPKQRLSLEQLKETPEYKRLTPKQQLFVATYVAGGLSDGNYDAVLATRTAYPCRSEEVARIMSYAIMANIRIIAVLNRHFGAEPIEEFLALLDRAINNKRITIAQVNALKLKCDILGLANRLPGFKSPIGVIPEDVLEASRKERKTKKDAQKDARPPKAPKADSDYNFKK